MIVGMTSEKIIADIQKPDRKAPSPGLRVKMNSYIFRDGEKAKVTVHVGKKSKIVIFCRSFAAPLK